jgi:hypothetical protein
VFFDAGLRDERGRQGAVPTYWITEITSQLAEHTVQVYDRAMQSDLLSEFYRSAPATSCFEEPANLLSDEGFFGWKDAIFYGRCSRGTLQRSPRRDLCDVSEYAVWHDGRCSLPFDPAEVAENLRRERYVPIPQPWSRWTFDLIQKTYYSVRPYLNVTCRRPLQRVYLKRRRGLSFPQWPVDTSVERLCEMLMSMVCERSRDKKIPFIWFWPEGAEGCVMLTHDVEERAGLDFCEQLMDLDEAFGLRSAFQVVPEGRYPLPIGFIDETRGRGFEVNVQDLNHDGMLFHDRVEFGRRAILIEHYRQKFGANGFRSAAMYRNEEWYDQLHFQFDMSIPNVAHLEPQRGGCCTVMPYFVGSMIELPLTTTQDYSLFHILGDYSLSLWEQQIDLILRKNGLISFLVHPDYIRGGRERDVYLELLRYLAHMREHRKLWFALPGEVNDWWRQRAAMELLPEELGWTIRGPGSERAEIAYASVIDGELVYELSPEKRPQRHVQFRFREKPADWPIPSAEPTHLGSA